MKIFSATSQPSKMAIRWRKELPSTTKKLGMTASKNTELKTSMVVSPETATLVAAQENVIHSVMVIALEEIPAASLIQAVEEVTVMVVVTDMVVTDMVVTDMMIAAGGEEMITDVMIVVGEEGILTMTDINCFWLWGGRDS